MSRKRHENTTSRLRRGVVLACVLFALGAGAPVSAQRGSDRDATLELERSQQRAGARVVQQREVSLEEAVEIASREVEGQVVSARTVTRNGRRVHEVRILEDGRFVRTVRVDAATGRIRR